MDIRDFGIQQLMAIIHIASRFWINECIGKIGTITCTLKFVLSQAYQSGEITLRTTWRSTLCNRETIKNV